MEVVVLSKSEAVLQLRDSDRLSQNPFQGRTRAHASSRATEIKPLSGLISHTASHSTAHCEPSGPERCRPLQKRPKGQRAPSHPIPSHPIPSHPIAVPGVPAAWPTVAAAVLEGWHPPRGFKRLRPFPPLVLFHGREAPRDAARSPDLPFPSRRLLASAGRQRGAGRAAATAARGDAASPARAREPAAAAGGQRTAAASGSRARRPPPQGGRRRPPHAPGRRASGGGRGGAAEQSRALGSERRPPARTPPPRPAGRPRARRT